MQDAETDCIRWVALLVLLVLLLAVVVVVVVPFLVSRHRKSRKTSYTVLVNTRRYVYVRLY